MEIERLSDEVLIGLLRQSEYDGVYAGPWWELPAVDRGSSGARGWKRAILWRRPGGGAEHWGHLFLLEGPVDRGVRMTREQLPGLPEVGPPGSEIAFDFLAPGGRRIELRARARSPALSERLGQIARQLAHGLAERMGVPGSEDPGSAREYAGSG